MLVEMVASRSKQLSSDVYIFARAVRLMGSPYTLAVLDRLD